MKKPILYIAGSIALALSMTVYYFIPIQETLKEIPATSTTKTVRYISIATSTPYTVVSGEFPQFPGVLDGFNEIIQRSIVTSAESHAQASKEAWKARLETALPGQKIPLFPTEQEKMYFVASSSIVRNDSNIISFVIYLYEYTGGAHGSEAILSFNYDVQAKKMITLSDLTKGDSKFLEKLSTLSRTKLRKDLAERANMKQEEIDTDMLNDGTTPTLENFSVFTIPKDNQVTFYFTQYQVAAYVFGSSQITVDLPLK